MRFTLTVIAASLKLYECPEHCLLTVARTAGPHRELQKVFFIQPLIGDKLVKVLESIPR